nr:carcinoembryonic antigen-related cell adhesion molecule 1 [Nothobranchius furzeri]
MDLFDFLLLFLLSFTGSCFAQSVLPPGPKDAAVGQNVTLNLLYVTKPDDITVWSYSNGATATNVATLRPTGVQVNAAYKGRASVNTTNGYLTLASLTAKDSGEYSVSIIGDGDTLTGEIKVRVLDPVSNVVIKSDLPEAIEQNSTVVLTCSASGSFLKFSWTNITSPIVADGTRLTFTDTDNSSKLTIKDVLRSDLMGPIFCKAENSLQSAQSPAFNLTVYYGPDNVFITPLKPTEYIESKTDFNLTCSTTSSPPATFTWFHNTTPIKATGPILTLKTIEEQGFGKRIGDYSCRAQNAKTSRMASSAAVRFTVMEPISGAKITYPSGVLIAGNSSANLSCQAMSGNVTEITWLKDDKPLVSGPLVVISSDKSSVFISLLKKEDNGLYTCRLRNAVSKKEDFYKMVVIYGPEPAKVEGDNQAQLDQRVVLTCAAASIPPANITWKLNGTVLNTKTNEFIIENALYKDSGTYTCEAYNAVTGRTTTYSHVLMVKEEIDNGLSDGAIAGIVIACLVALAASIALIFYCRQKVPVESPY